MPAGRPNPTQTADKLLARLERDRRILELMRRGRGTTEIARETGLSVRHVTDIRKRILTEAADERLLERRLCVAESLMRLEALLDAIWDAAAEGSVKHVTEARLLVAEMAQYTDAKAAVRIEFGESDVDRALREMDELHRRRAAEAALEAARMEGEAR